MILIKGMIDSANPHLQCLIENSEENYYFGISGGTQGKEFEGGTEE